MPIYFNKFPKLLYTKDNTTTLVTNLLTRVAVIKGVLDVSSLFYEYDIQEGDTPEIVASKYYGDSEYHWVVLIFNEVMDPYYDWVMAYDQFQKYIESKYTNKRYAVDTMLTGNMEFSNTSNVVTGIGTQFLDQVTPGLQLIYMSTNSSNVVSFISIVKSVESDTQLTLTSNATFTANTSYFGDKIGTGIHHFEKVVEKYDNVSLSTTTTTYEIDYNTYLEMTAEPKYSVGVLPSGTVNIKEYRRIVSLYDYEDKLNESKRRIKLIKKELLPDLLVQFEEIMKMGA